MKLLYPISLCVIQVGLGRVLNTLPLWISPTHIIRLTWLSVFSIYNILEGPIAIFCDNKATISLMKRNAISIKS